MIFFKEFNGCMLYQLYQLNSMIKSLIQILFFYFICSYTRFFFNKNVFIRYFILVYFSTGFDLILLNSYLLITTGDEPKMFKSESKLKPLQSCKQL